MHFNTVTEKEEEEGHFLNSYLYSSTSSAVRRFFRTQYVLINMTLINLHLFEFQLTQGRRGGGGVREAGRQRHTKA